ncbi:hypothetical protein [Synechococcus phage S-N03]|uniref:Uncharacterized protein n=1 Tax=Synechococcus phage S-N03 TaxID=2718943 RepID=A0A6G8R5J4_9CAUD|nr:hypothetical protein PQC09_gp017 [Synechococcus phage S-N03]QIN96652.1 hypothetical protein [Synechococcus phage S-N03]
MFVKLLAAALVGAMTIGVVEKQPVVDRSNRVMCEEVAHELDQQYVAEMITRERAQQIVDRCYRIFVDAK